MIFRTNIQNGDYSKLGWVAVDLNRDRIIESCFSRKSYTTGGSCTSSNEIGRTPENYRICLWNDKIVIQSNNQNYYFPTSDILCDLTPIPTEPYKSNNQEVYSGILKVYFCETSLLIDNNQVETATYSGKTIGYYQTKEYTIQGDQQVSFSGNIHYTVIDDSSACSVSQCNSLNTGYYKCLDLNGCLTRSEALTLCSEGKSCVQKSSGAVCEITSEIKEEIETPEKPSFNWKLWGIIIGLIGLIITIAKFILILTSSSRSP